MASHPVCASMKWLPGKPPSLFQPLANLINLWEEMSMGFIVDPPESTGNMVIWTTTDLSSKQAYLRGS